MEPLKPSDKRKLAKAVPSVDPKEIEEYERLLSNRFTTDPDATPGRTTAGASGPSSAETRLRELYDKFGKVLKSTD